MQGLAGGMIRPEEGELTPFRQFVFDQRWLVRQLVEDSRFNQAFLGITLLNTLFLALAYDGNPTLNLSATPNTEVQSLRQDYFGAQQQNALDLCGLCNPQPTPSPAPSITEPTYSEPGTVGALPG